MIFAVLFGFVTCKFDSVLPKSPSSFGTNFIHVSHLLMDFKMFLGKIKISMLYNILYSNSF